MKHAAAAGVLAALLTVSGIASPQSQPAADSQPSNAERIESGTVPTPDGKPVAYRIRLLPVSSFPDLPAPVAAELIRRQCMIPQSFEARQPENILHGAFRAAGSSDWAALCSVQNVTTLYVFFAGHADDPIALRSQPDTTWLGSEPGQPILGSSWGIAVRPASELRSSPELRRGAAIDHDAIDDARLERSVIIHYFESGHWIALNRADSDE